ncbi:helicase-related protein [Cohnella caldifontis]|uniref:helicase-related protein n=1 Tax=Cohnella caldifontis TaxID=3027471 RepID=UPI003BB51EC8
MITKSNVVASDLAAFLEERFGSRTVLNITNQDSVHDVIEILEKFGKRPESTVLVLTDSANAGLDVTAANHLIHYDYPLKSTDMTGRNNRISRQTSGHPEAVIYYLMTAGRIDEFEFACSEPKNRAVNRNSAPYGS